MPSKTKETVALENVALMMMEKKNKMSAKEGTPTKFGTTIRKYLKSKDYKLKVDLPFFMNI